MSIVPMSLYFNNKGIAKLSIGIGKGKKKYDKRATIKDKEWKIKKQRLEKNKKKTLLRPPKCKKKWSYN